MNSILLAWRDGPRAADWLCQLQGMAEWQVHGPAASVADTRHGLVRHRPVLLVLDLRLRDGGAIDLIRVIRSGAHGAPGLARAQVLALAEDDSDPLLLDALQAGADNFFVRADTRRGALAAHVRDTLAGGADIAPWIARRLLEHFGGTRQQVRRVPVEELADPLSLTPDEHRLLRQLSRGAPLREVAQFEGVRPHDLTSRVRAIYRKMQWALRAGDLRLA
jgi:DNA-binding NarL/FixJ family response regulator